MTFREQNQSRQNITPADKRQGRVTLQAGLSNVIEQMDAMSSSQNDNSSKLSQKLRASDPESAMKKAFRAQKVLDLYRNCVIDVFGQAANLILSKTNAVYILKEPDKGMKRTASPEDKIVIKLIIYTCDSTVHSELDNRQEQIKIWFIDHDEQVEKIQLLHSKFGMRRRAPYQSYLLSNSAGL